MLKSNNTSIRPIYQLRRLPGAFSVHQQIPNVVRLQVHLPGCHPVTFDPDGPQEQILARVAQEKTTLTVFFRANANPEIAPIAKQLTYQEFPQQFVYDSQTKE